MKKTLTSTSKLNLKSMGLRSRPNLSQAADVLRDEEVEDEGEEKEHMRSGMISILSLKTTKPTTPLNMEFEKKYKHSYNAASNNGTTHMR